MKDGRIEIEDRRTKEERTLDETLDALLEEHGAESVLIGFVTLCQQRANECLFDEMAPVVDWLRDIGEDWERASERFKRVLLYIGDEEEGGIARIDQEEEIDEDERLPA